MKISPPFGIDLGTTRTVAAVFPPDADAPSVAVDEQGRAPLPSVVASAGDSRWHAGYDAIETADESGTPRIESFKRLMGSDEEVRHAKGLLPEDLSAIVLSAVANRMERHLDDSHAGRSFDPRQAVITVPAYFDAPQIEATRRAGEQAGIDVGGLVQEPTAAAIYHTWNRGLGDGTFLVYDLGGGTFDVSIIRAVYGEYQVLSIDGDNHLGGDDFDRRLADILRRRLADEGYQLGDDVDDETDRAAFDILQRLARDTKESLSDVQSVELDEPELFDDRSGRSIDLCTTVEREDFESAIDDLLDSTVLACRRAVETASSRHDLEPTDIDGIFMVGGSTRVPAVDERLRDTIGADLDIAADQIVGDMPETSVARGAALHAAAVCSCDFHSDDVTVSITDFPADSPDAHLIGDVDVDGDVEPDEIGFGVADGHTVRRATLEGRSQPLRFSLPDFDASKLHPESSPDVATALYRGDSMVVGPFELWIPERPENARPAPTLALTNPAVLAKDINVEIVEDGEPTRYTLIEEGAHLPTTVHRELRTGDQSGALILRLFQHRLPIHTLALHLPDDLAPGTPFELSVDVDQAMNIRASGTVGDQKFEARIDRPSAPRRRQWNEIEELIDRIEETDQRLWGVEQRRFRKQSTNIRDGIQAAVRHDPRRLQVLARRLESLLEEYAPRPERSPGRRRVEAMLDTIRRIVFAADGDRLGRSHQEWSDKLEKMSREIDEAWDCEDDARWKAIADRIQATYESVAQDEFQFRRRNPEQYAFTLFETTSSRLQSIRRSIDSFNYASDGDAEKLQRSEIEAIENNLAKLKRRLPDPPPTPDDITSLEKLARSANHVEERLERIRTLGLPKAEDN